MKKTNSIILRLLVMSMIGCFGAGTAHAHAYMNGDNWADIPALMAEMRTIIGTVMTNTGGTNLWEDNGGPNGIWRSVIGQAGPGWIGYDHGRTCTSPTDTGVGSGTNMRDDYQIGLLDKVLNPASCSAALPAGRAQEVRDAYAANRAAVKTKELTIYGVRLTARLNIVSLCGIGDTSIDTTADLTTGSPATLNLPILGDTSFDVPSLWNTDSAILNDLEPKGKVRDAMVDMTAAYLTLGDTRATDYWYAFIGRFAGTFVNEMLGTIISKLLENMKVDASKGDENEALLQVLLQAIVEGMPYAEVKLDDSGKVSCPPWGNVPGVDITLPDSVLQKLLSDAGISAKICDSARIRISDTNVCNTIRNFANKFLPSAGFSCKEAYFATKSSPSYVGNLNGDSSFNLNTFYSGSQDFNYYVQHEWAGYANPITIQTQPVGNIAPDPVIPIPYGGAAWPLSVIVDATDVNKPHNFQWYSGPNPGSMTAIPSATSRTYNAPSNAAGTTYYRCDVSDPCAFSTTPSTAVAVKVEVPPLFITGHPSGGSIPYGGTSSISVTATQTDGILSYEWFHDPDGSGPQPFVVVQDSASNAYQIVGATFDDNGVYYCVVHSTNFGNQATSNQAAISVSSPVPVVTLDPIGGSFDLGAIVDLSCDATIGIGGLTFQWELNRSNAGGPLPGPGPVYWNIPSMGMPDVGFYRCKVTSSDFGTSAYSAEVFVGIGGGAGSVARVDKNAPRPGGLADGLTWETAFATIQEGIDAVEVTGGEVWVAGGPMPGGTVYDELRTQLWGDNPVEGSLILKDGVAVYGGFEGYLGRQEVALAQRGVRRAVTIIDGSHARGGAAAYHVVAIGKAAFPVVNAVLDGFDITGGNASGEAGDYHTWRGAGVYNWGSQPVIANCTFYGNTAEVAGGAIANESFGSSLANAVIQNCVFTNNTALRNEDTGTVLQPGPNPIRGGGAIYNDQANPAILYCTFYNNNIGPYENVGVGESFGDTSGGILNYETTLSLTINSCIFWAHTAGPMQTHCIVGSPTCAPPVPAFSNMQTANPQFVAAGPEFLLTPGSPCVNTGDPANPAPNRDLPGSPRPQPAAGRVDQGAYEYVDVTGLNFVAACKATSVDIDETLQVKIYPTNVYDPASVVPGGLWYWKVNDADSVTFNCANIGANQVTLKLIDFQGHTATCQANVTVGDSVAPNAVCKDITVSLDSNGVYNLTKEEIDGGTTDNCSFTLSIPPTQFTCANLGSSQIVTLTATDADGNTDQCNASVTVVDTVDPTVVTRNVSVDLNALGSATVTADQVNNGSSDNCSMNTVYLPVLDKTNFTCADIAAPVTVVLTVTDSVGNTATGTASVTVHDVTKPTLSLIGSDNMLLVIGVSNYVEQYATFNDTCDGTGTLTAANVSGDVIPNPLQAGDEGTYTIRYNFSDSSGNAADEITRTVTVIANNPPVITLLGDNPAVVECKSVASYVDAGATASDVEDGSLPVVITGELNVLPDQPGTYTITFTTTDRDPSNPLTTTVYRTVNVVDLEPPVITLVGSATLGWPTGVTFVDPGATADDFCQGSLTVGPPTGVLDVNTPGTYTLTYNVSDASGNPAAPVVRTVYVGDLLTYIGQPLDTNAYVDSAPFELHATFQNGFTPTTFEWFRTPGGSVLTDAVTDNTVSLTVTPTELAVGAYEYYVEVTDSTGPHPSESATVLIGNHVVIDPNLDSEYVVVPDHNFSMGIKAAEGIGNLTYEWQKMTSGKADWMAVLDGANISGAETDTLSFTPYTEEDAGQYRVLVSDGNGLGEQTPSNVATITNGTGVPVAAPLGMAILTALSALGGALAIRRRK